MLQPNLSPTSLLSRPLLLLLLLLIVIQSFPSTSAETFDWKDSAFLSINFGPDAPAPYVKYSPKQITTPKQFKTYSNDESLPLGVYGSHIWAYPWFTYMLDLTTSSFNLVDLKFGFAEIYKLSCRLKGRSFDIYVNGQPQLDINIFMLVKCRKPHDIVFSAIDASAPINITMVARLGSPMIANLVVRQSTTPVTIPPPTTTTTLPVTVTQVIVDKSNTTDVSGPASKSIATSEDAIVINAGSNTGIDIIPGTTVIRNDDVLVQGTVRPKFFTSSRSAGKFSYVFNGEEDSSYQIQLGFAENDPNYCSGLESRIFSVFLNGDVVKDLKDVNITDRVGCRQALIWTHPGLSFGSKLKLTFEGKESHAIVSYLMVRKLRGACVPESIADGKTADHLAHSVPGSYPIVKSASSRRSYADADQNGFETVRINGDGSHSHFFDVSTAVVGRITHYLWTNPDTTEFISDKQIFNFDFYKGTTRLFLDVEDNVCSTHLAETTVTVTGSVTRGSYCYFYSGESSMTEGSGVDIERKPDFAKWYSSITWDFSGLPIESAFSARCFFFLETPADAINLQGMLKTTGGGMVSLLRGSEAVVDHSTTSSFNETLVASITAFELRYVRKAKDVKPTISLEVDPGTPVKVLYDASTVFPVITNLKPSQSDLNGLDYVSLQIIGPLTKPESVTIGSQTVPVISMDWSTKKVLFKVPPVKESEDADVFLTWKGGVTSNMLKFKYIGGPVDDPIRFNEIPMKDKDTGKNTKNDLATCIRIGPDGDLYLGTLGAKVLKLTYDMDKLVVTSRCSSKILMDTRFLKNGVPAQRDILGMVLDPRDQFPRPYIATQTLFWWDKDRVDRNNTMAWRNGAIERLKPGTDPNDPSICLVYDKKIIWDLPISNHDHGTNGLEFTDEGDLLVSVGGFTNSGLPGKGLGLFWEVPLSSTILKFKLSHGRFFDGRITYTNDTHPHLGETSKGDYEIVATGVRNAFFLALHSSQRLYTMDNGPNVAFGNVAANCHEVNSYPNYPPDPPTDYPGTIKVRQGWKAFSLGRPDKLLWIKTDETSPRFYGHPHLHRGQCSWIDPQTHKDVLGRDPPSNYDKQLMSIPSSVNAIFEYHAGNVFGGKMKGHLVMSRFKNRKTFSLPPISKPEEANVEELSEMGGLSAVMNARGDIIIPRLSGNNFIVLRPKVPRLEESKHVSITAVTPFRFGRKGRVTATIYGYNFGTGWARVRIGGRVCVIRTHTDSVITCRVPWAKVPGKLADVEVSLGRGRRAQLKGGVWYMKV